MQVPAVGFEKLLVSLIRVDTGRVGPQTARAIAKNGNCQWAETVTEELKLVKDPKTGGYERRDYRFLVTAVSQMGLGGGGGRVGMWEEEGWGS